VTPESYEAIFGAGGARHPDTLGRLVATTRRPGMELVIAAHKSVAELGVIGRAEDMHAIMDAERDATLADLDRVTRQMGGRRGRAATASQTGGLIYAHTRQLSSSSRSTSPRGAGRNRYSARSDTSRRPCRSRRSHRTHRSTGWSAPRRELTSAAESRSHPPPENSAEIWRSAVPAPKQSRGDQEQALHPQNVHFPAARCRQRAASRSRCWVSCSTVTSASRPAFWCPQTRLDRSWRQLRAALLVSHGCTGW
jgi:hypothetical protein